MSNTADRAKEILGYFVLTKEDGSLDFAKMATREFFDSLTSELRMKYTAAGLGKKFHDEATRALGHNGVNLELARRESERAAAAVAFEAAFGTSPAEGAMQAWVVAYVQGLTGDEVTDAIYALMSQSGSTVDVQPTDPAALVPWQQAQALLQGARLGWFPQPVMYSPSGAGGGR